jgi:hypothetical protein
LCGTGIKLAPSEFNPKLCGFVAEAVLIAELDCTARAQSS